MRRMQTEKEQSLRKDVESGRQGKAFKSAQKRIQDGPVDTAHVTQSDGRRRAAVSGKEVREHQQEVAEDWMGRRHKRWFYTAEGCLAGAEAMRDEGLELHELWRRDDVGRAARAKLADGTFSQDEGLMSRLPVCCKAVVVLAKAVMH